MRLAIAGNALVLAFDCLRREWTLRSAEVRRGEQTLTFTCGQLADAVDALLQP